MGGMNPLDVAISALSDGGCIGFNESPASPFREVPASYVHGRLREAGVTDSDEQRRIALEALGQLGGEVSSSTHRPSAVNAPAFRQPTRATSYSVPRSKVREPQS